MNPLEPKRRKLKFRGVPREGNPQTASRWQKFIRIILPWFAEKKEQGERFIDAKLAQEHALAIDILADAQLKQAQAKKLKAETENLLLEGRAIAQNAEKVEEKLKKKPETQEMTLEEMIEGLEELLRIASLTYGTRISIELKEGKLLVSAGAGTVKKISLEEELFKFAEEIEAWHKQIKDLEG